jgi:hypothetical protein
VIFASLGICFDPVSQERKDSYALKMKNEPLLCYLCGEDCSDNYYQGIDDLGNITYYCDLCGVLVFDRTRGTA